jgi:lipopolysaccharide heptosyltransferase II
MALLIPQTDQELRILVVRPDRLGDVILSTPVFEVIKNHYSRCRLTVMVRAEHVPLIQGLPFIDEIMIFDPLGAHAGFRGFKRLTRELREKKFRVAITLQGNLKIAAAIFFAPILHRVGPLSKMYSFFFYNRGIRQSRSQVEMHETDYNLQLLRRLGIRISTRTVDTKVHFSQETLKAATQWLQDAKYDSKKELIAIHPGMGGSALNWPENYYGDLIRALVKEGRQVLITGGALDFAMIERLKSFIGVDASKVMFYGGPVSAPVDFLGALFSHASLVIAPSTGPLHVAVALGKRVVTFYSPVRVQSAIRWGPYLKDESKASVLVPEVYCGQEFHCLGSLCNYYPCMKTLTVNHVLNEIKVQLGKLNG